MASVTSELLSAQQQVAEFADLSDQMSGVTTYIAKIEKLVLDKIVSEVEGSDLIETYKTNIKSVISKMGTRIQKQCSNISNAANTEVNKIVASITPVISGSPVITNPTPPQASVEATAALATTASIVADLNKIIGNFNKVLS